MDVDGGQAEPIVDSDNDEVTSVALESEQYATSSAIATNSEQHEHGKATSVTGTSCVSATNNLYKERLENKSNTTTDVQADVALCQNSGIEAFMPNEDNLSSDGESILAFMPNEDYLSSDNESILALMPNEDHRSNDSVSGTLYNALFCERDDGRDNEAEMLQEERQIENAGIDPNYPLVLVQRVSVPSMMDQDNISSESFGESPISELNTLRNNETQFLASLERIEIGVPEQREEQQIENAGIDPNYPIVLLERVSLPPIDNANSAGDSPTVGNSRTRVDITGTSCGSVTNNLYKERLENTMQCSSNATLDVEADVALCPNSVIEASMPNEEDYSSSDSESGTSSTVVSNSALCCHRHDEITGSGSEAEMLQEERQIENAGIDPNYPQVLVQRVSVPSMMDQDNISSESFGESSISELNTLRNNESQFLASLERIEIGVPEQREEQQIENAGIDPNYPIVLLERVSLPPIDNADSGGDSSINDADIIALNGRGLAAAAVENSTDSDDSDFDIASMSDDDESEAVILQNPNLHNFHNQLVILRNMIQQTRRSMAEAEASFAPSNMRPRNALMQRFRRVLFILNSRRRRLIRLIRLGWPAPDEENPEGEANAEMEVAGEDLLNENPDNEESNMTIEQEEMNENAVRFDTSLPVQHSYLGTNMSRVSGVNYLDDHQYVKLRLFVHQHVLFPGEVLPFMVNSSASIIDGDHDEQNGIMFGLCFPSLTQGGSNKSEHLLYGVTCQIYELGTDGRGNTLIKSRALQRFVTKMDDLTVPLENINSHPRMKCSGYVKILPDIYVPEPFKCMNMGSMNRFRDNSSMTESYRRFQAATMPWPAQIYETHNISKLIIKARAQLAQHKIDTIPTDPTQLSYWLLRNLHLPEDIITSVFLADTVNTRLKLLASVFAKEAIFACLSCDTHIANCCELFAMSKHGVQSQYCNSAGYIHETNTVYRVSHQNIIYSGSPSTEFSWFPGYQWRIIVCKFCEHHLGWEFKAVEPNLVPKLFFGISSASVRVRFAP